MKKRLIIMLVLLAALTGCNTTASDNQKQEIIEEEQEETMKLEDVYGTWTFSKVMIDGSTYTVKEMEALGDDSLSDVYFVFKEGGSVYLYAGEDDEGNHTYEYDEENNVITAGTIDFIIGHNELSIEFDEGTAYLEKYSNSQDITEIPKNLTEEGNEDIVQNEEQTEVNNNEIRPEIKEAIDSYEIFIDEYCDFMEQYAQSDGKDLSILADYADFLSKLADMESKMDKLEADLTDAEALYYSEVMLRCGQKLLKIAY